MPCVVRDAAELSEPILQDFFAYWDRVREGRRFPGRGDIDPVDMPAHILPHLMLIEVLADISDFRFRLAGTKVVEGAGYELRGRLASEGPANDPEALCRDMALVVGDGRPRHLRLGCNERPRGFRSVEKVLAPLSRDGDDIDMLFGAAMFHRSPPDDVS